MASPPLPPRIAAGDHAGSGSALGSSGRSSMTKPYDREIFLAFMAAATRLFCDDEQIVIADFLAHEEKAYTERDLIDRLGWPDKRVREVCASLERLMLVQKEQLISTNTQAASSAGAEGDASSSTVGSNTESTRGAPGGAALLGTSTSSAAPSYYRVSPYAIIVCQYRIDQLDARLKQQKLEAESRDAFSCPVCGRQFDTLEAQRLRLDPEDARFLCECGAKLEHEDSRTVVEQLDSLQKRCQEQLQVLRNLISRSWNMRVPVFPPFTRADKNEFKKTQDQKKQAAASSVGSSASGGSDTQANAAKNTWHHRGSSGVKVQISSAPVDQDAAKRSTPLWLRSGGGTVSGAVGSVPSGFGSFPSSSLTVAAAPAAAGGPQGVPPPFTDTRAPVKTNPRNSVSGSSPGSSVAGGMAESATGATRGQIKFSMKTSNKLHALRGTPASRAAAAAAAAKSQGAAGKSSQPAGENKVPSTAEAKGAQQQAPAGAAVEAMPATEVTTAGTAAALGAESAPQAAAPEDAPRVFISRLGRDFTLEEAVEHQLEMSIEEHEKFMELQSMYLDDL